ncbi:unnamed protein product [Linum tenue]|uniref:F-box domain-containing protein n=2 Tax=Linum tenue TaxID=586396 RepID=A0AAV0NG19_9ROSI|nr:unnamed protein product [Linum tenue]
MEPHPPQPQQLSFSTPSSRICIISILLDLPAKSLLRFKCVSKAWHRLISHPKFQETHYARRASVPRFFFRFSDFDYDQFSGTVRQRFAILNSAGVPLDVLRVNAVGGPIKLVLLSSRGLLCFATETCVYLCNPATRSLIQLPPPHGVDRQGNPLTISGFGFGYMESAGEYKVARVVHRPWLGDHSPCKLECSVFTYSVSAQPPAAAAAATNDWKLLADTCPYFVTQVGLPVFARGTESIYWKIVQNQHCLCHSTAQARPDVFLAYLDVKKERFGVVRWPQGLRRPRPSVGDWREAGSVGKLSMIETPEDLPLRLVVWLLTDQENSHWVRQAVVSLPVFGHGTILGEIKECRSDLIIYSSPENAIIFINPENGTFRKVSIPANLRSLDFCTYTENLLTLQLPPNQGGN